MTYTWVGRAPDVRRTTLTFLAADGATTLSYDVYVKQPAQAGPTRLMVTTHGGGFGIEAGVDRTAMEDVCKHAVQYCGFVAMSPDYRTGATHPYPSSHLDVELAIVDVFAQNLVDTLYIDPTLLPVGFGSSAGGTIIGEVEANRDFACMAWWSGMTDLTTVESQPSSSHGTLVAAVAAYTGHNAALMAEASPALHATAALSPHRMVNSELELMPEEQAYEMGAALDSVVVPNTVAIRAGSSLHATQYINTEWQPTLDWVLANMTGPTAAIAPGEILATITT